MTTAEANRRYFDSISGSYDSKPWFATVNNQVTNALRSDLTWVGIQFAHTGNSDVDHVRLLDYACGTGLMTRVFGPYVTQTLGIDISSNMVSTYNTRARDTGLPENLVKAVTGDIFDKASPSPVEVSGAEWFNFDLATVGFGFHHFEDVVHSARQLKERLRPGGVLVINDFLEGGDMLADENGAPIDGTEGNHAHSHGHSHGHEHRHGHGHKQHSHDHSSSHHHHAEHHSHGHAHIEQPIENPELEKPSTSSQHTFDDTTPEFKQKMEASIIVPHFTLEGVREFFTEAGFVDVDVITMKEQAYMEFGGKKLWRTILFARGRRPVIEQQEKEKSEL